MQNTFLVLLLSAALNLAAQQTPSRLNTSITDTIKTDSVKRDTAGMDSVSVKTATGLNSEIKYTAEDSIKFSIDGSIIYLYGKGRIYYEDLELDADYIRIEQKSKMLFASGKKDKYSVYRGRPIFKQGSDAPVTTDSLIFNFETKKGKAFGTATSADEGYIQARQFKKNEFNEGFLKDGIYSTCSLPEPYTHFGIHIDKGIITEKQVIAKSAYLEIEHIPIYFAYLPFGFFPKTNKRSSGFRFPTFGEDATRGFYMQGIGWYLGINDYWDADITGTLYSKGSYDISTVGRYKKNYKYNGSLTFNYASTKDPNGIEGTPSNRASKDFRVSWHHTQDQAARPGSNFGASVDFGTSAYNTNSRVGGTYNYGNLVQNTMSSSINYSTNLFDGLFNFSTSLSHRQDLTSKTVNLTLPQFNLGLTQQINPFDSKDRVGEQKWYQKISFNYSLAGENTFNGQESDLFSKGTLSKFQNSFRHAIPVNLTLNVLKVLQFNTGVNYNELWTFQTMRKTFDPTASGNVRTDTVQGFARNYNYSVSGGFSTKVYGKVNFKKGNLVALRHVMSPSVSFNYSPDFTNPRFGFYREIANLPEAGNKYGDSIRYIIGNPKYSIFQSGGGGTRQAAISFSLDNNIDAKKRTKSDTSASTENVSIIQGLNFRGNYNFAADSMKLSPISFSGRTAFFKQKIGLNFGGTFNPYQVVNVNGTGRPINRFTFENGKLARLTNLNLSTDFSFNSAALAKRNEELRKKQDDPNISPAQQQDIRSILMNPNYYVDFNVPWNFSASYSFNYSSDGIRSTITNTLNFNGDFSLTQKWKIQFNSGYDFRSKKISQSQFSINRDLHCWDMAVSWIPFGTYKSYNINIRVRASILQDLKLSRRSASINPYAD
ncbi:putative LPS assembly protein LptD [Arcticibacter tournemirensis]|uniref:putative LPS assembly protein LptD n=1 Tax=Arcticibacter tournemirensis TaxID=699437 RepID=UPI001F17D66D|nr:putative LPS assembly protein LptD [Arcticibacter tournemirensis]